MQAPLHAGCTASAASCSHHSELRVHVRCDSTAGCGPQSSAVRRLRRTPFAPAHGVRRRGVHCQASESDGEASVKNRITSTLSGLDMLLGIDPEEEAKKKRKDDDEEKRKSDAKRASEARSAATASMDSDKVSANTSVLDKIRAADAERESNRREAQRERGSSGADDGNGEKLGGQIEKIVELGKRLAEKQANRESGKTDTDDDEKLQKELAELMDMTLTTIPKEDVARMRTDVFTPSTFRISNADQMTGLDQMTRRSDILAGGLLVQGTLRMRREEVFDAVNSNLKDCFGDKYELFLIPDIGEQDPDPRGGPRVAWQVLPGEACRPKPANKWQWAFAVALAALTAGSCLQLGLASNVFLLPKETVAWLSNPSDLPPGAVPPGLEGWDPVPFFRSVLPISFSVLGVNLAHEVAHRVVASIRRVKLGPSFFIPNGQLGSFGAVTPVRSMVRKRRDLFDVSVAGPAAAGAASLALFLAGLAMSRGGDAAGLVAVPGALFQGSLALGSLVQSTLGEVRAGGSLPVHPLLVAGWAGLVSTALNLLPVGNIDGGRMTQGAFGRQALGVTSFFTYVGLGLGFLGSALALPFGLYILILQREPESTLQDSVTAPSSSRQVAAAALIFAAILILLPLAPDLADSISSGGGGGSDPAMFL